MKAGRSAPDDGHAQCASPTGGLAAATTAPAFARGQLLLAGIATLVGAVVRWPALQQIPRFTDETVEIQFALDIARQGLRPIVSVDTYNGPLVHYLLAMGFRAGAGAQWPRLLAFLCGSLTVGVTFLLGSSLAALCMAREARQTQRLAGLVAAGLMAVAMVPVVVNSHVAWSHATTPFWAALALLALLEVWRRERPAGLLVAAVLLALVQQSHWSGVVFLLAAAIWLIASRRCWLRSSWPYLALLVWLGAVGNLLLYNVASHGGSLAVARPHSTTLSEGLRLADILGNGRGFVGLAFQVVSSSFASRCQGASSQVAAGIALVSPGALLYGVLALAGLLWTARQGGLALACWLAAGAVFPLLNSRWYHFILGRYVSPLLPITYAAIACTLLAPLNSARSARGRRLAASACALVAVLLVAHAARHLHAHYRCEYAAGRTNDRIWQIVHGARALASAERPLYVDRDLKEQRLTMGGHVLKAFDALLRADGIAFDKERTSDNPGSLVGSYLVIGDAQRDALPPTIRLEPVDVGAPPAAASPGAFWLYRVLPRDSR